MIVMIIMQTSTHRKDTVMIAGSQILAALGFDRSLRSLSRASTARYARCRRLINAGASESGLGQ